METAKKEIQAFKLAMAFRNKYLAYDKKIYSKATIKSSKWWNFFVKSVELFGEEKEWDIEKYVNSLFSNGKVLPFKVANPSSWKLYLETNTETKEFSDTENVILKVLQGFNAVKNYCINNDQPFSVNFYVDNKINKKNLENETIPLHFFTFSKWFNENFTDLAEIIALKKSIVYMRSKEVVKKVKIILKEDFLE